MAQETSTAPVVAPQETEDFMPLNGVDHVELYVGNALQAAYYYTRAFGFQEIAYRGLETGTRDLVSHVVQQGRIRLVLTGALHSDSAIAAHQHKHGDGVKVIALSVPDAEHAYREATARAALAGALRPAFLAGMCVSALVLPIVLAWVRDVRLRRSFDDVTEEVAGPAAAPPTRAE